MAGMAGEQDDLFVFGEVFQDGRSGLLPIRVEINERVVEDEKSVAALEEPARHRKPHGESETGAGPGGEGRKRNGRRVVARGRAGFGTDRPVALAGQR